MRNILALLTIIFITCCKPDIQKKLQTGTWRAILEVQDNNELPFIFEVESEGHLKIYNAEEVIAVDDIQYRNDSVYIQMPVFPTYIAAKFVNKETLKGSFFDNERNREVPFSATYGIAKRFDTSKSALANITGNWQTVFSPGIQEDKYIAKGIFNQDGNNVTGTFRTTTGDYRYLEGAIDGNEFKLSTFDGSHAFLFIGTATDNTMKGMFYSGSHFKEPFVAKRNETYELTHADSLTVLKEGYDRFEFSFPDSEGNLVSHDDERFKNKVVLVQIMGSWCPNCLDESKFYSHHYNANKDKDFEIVALAVEHARTETQAFKNIKRLQDKIGIEYPILLAQTGTSSKTETQKKLPMLNHVLSYPTTIYVDKKGEVRKIHTGFNGPATGEKYIAFKTEFESFVSKLLSE
jgi:peroxiredoxin